MEKKIWGLFLLCYLVLFDALLASALTKESSVTKEPQKTGSPSIKTTVKTTSIPVTTTTQQPTKGVVQDKKIEHQEIHKSQMESGKPVPKKRAFSNDDGYFENEGRSKRTADFDDYYNRPPEHEIELTPEEMLALLTFLEESRAFGVGHASLWPYYENNINAIEEDMKDDDDDDDYGDGGGSHFGAIYDSTYDSYLSGIKNYPAGKRRRSSYLDEQRSDIPIFRRAVL